MLEKLLVLSLALALTEVSSSNVALNANGCPIDWRYELHLPHETDCNLFYKCTHGERVLMHCPAGLHFNPNSQDCDWPDAAGCTSGSGNSGEDGGEITTTEKANTEENGNSNEGGNGEFNPNGCPTNWLINLRLPHETDCNLFYMCAYGEKVLRQCPAGLHFNPISQDCDWPEQAGCTSGIENSSSEEDNSNENGNGSQESSAENGNGSEEDNSNESGNESQETGGENGKESEEDSNEDGKGSQETGGENGKESEEDSNESGKGSQETSSENGCPEDWNVHKLLPHETNCSLFYYCVRGDLVLTECPESLHFNPELQVCDWPDNAVCKNGGDGNGSNSGEDSKEESDNSDESGDGGDNSNSGEGGNTNENSNSEEDNTHKCPTDWNVHKLLPHESNCSQFYYCVRGDLVLRDCPESLHFNPSLEVCDWPENAGCKNGNVSSSGEESKEENSNSNESGDSVEQNTNKCPTDWNVHKLLPHESNCSQFYYCVRGDLVLRDCPESLHFNPSLEVCDWPENACCKNGNGSTSGEDGNGENGNSNESGDGGDSGSSGEGGDSEESSAEGNSNSEEENTNKCPTDWNVHKLLPHESNCSQFYYCVRGDLVLRDCPEGLHFNPSLEVCDWPENAGCKNSNVSTSGEESKEENSNSNESGDSVEENTNKCPTDWNVHKLLPHESNCSQFYYCVRGDLVLTNCPEGLHFNPTLQVCDWPSSAGCANGTGGSGESNSGENVSNGDSGEGNNSNESSNSGEGNNSNESGNSDENGNGEKPSCPTDWSVHQLLPHESNCSLYYYCIQGNLALMQCPVGLYFNADEQVCDWPESSGCTSGGSSSTESGENGNGNGESGEDGDSNEENNSSSNENTSGEDSGETDTPQDEKCKNGCNIAPWAHKKDCDKFWRCDGEKAVLTVCAEGLHFNPTMFTCDFICNANCIRNKVQITNGIDGLKIFVPWHKVDKQTMDVLDLKAL